MHSEQSRSSATTDPTTTGSTFASKSKKLKGDVEKKAFQLQNQNQMDQQYRVADPEDKNVDRTPLALFKAHTTKTMGRRVVPTAGGGASQTGEGGSVSQKSHSESDHSFSQVSSTSSDHLSSDTPDEESGAYMFEESSDSHSTMDPSTTSAMDRRKSGVSSEGQSTIEQSAKAGTRAAGDKKGDEAKIKESKPKEWTAQERRQWLDEHVTITLTETPTLFLYSRHDEVVSRENAAECEVVRQRNERYDFFKMTRRNDAGNQKRDDGSGKYASRGMTTLNNPLESVSTEITAPPSKAAGNIQVTTWKLYDEMRKANEEDEGEGEGAGGPAGAVGGEGEAEDTMNQDDDGGAQGDDDGNDDGGDDGDQAGGGGGGGVGKRPAAWLLSTTLLETLLVVERAVMQNLYEEEQLAYRGITMEELLDCLPSNAGDDLSHTTGGSLGSPFGGTRRTNLGNTSYNEKLDETRKTVADTEDGANDEKEEEASEEEIAQSLAAASGKTKLRILWRFGCEITKGKNTSCMAWNQKNPDILAAGYGEYGIPVGNSAQVAYSGIVCCWSLKNPIAPERVIHIESDAGVSAMHFAQHHPSLLAVGNTDGTLALYDIRKHGNSPALKTTVSTGQHTGTIWDLKWVERGKDRGENLMSISADGHVMEWSIKKGLERSADLMVLKRQGKDDQNGAVFGGKNKRAKEAILSRQSGGMCFDINPKETITYVVGTEDGTIHRCSKSQNTDYLADYKPHEEPVYRVRWSPYCHEYFLTCSADWTSRLYHMDRTDPLIKFDSNRQDAVHDVCWSHTTSTVFAAATAQGRVDVWDLADPLQPKSSLELEGRSLNCLLFAEQESPLLAVGDSSGEVHAIKLTGSEFERAGMSDGEQVDRLKDVIRKMAT